MRYKLELLGVCVWVHLGVGDHERFGKQPVYLDLALLFDREPDAVRTDRLCDTVCYEELIGGLRAHLADKRFNLVEGVHGAASRWLRDRGLSFELNVRKVRTPIEGVESVAYANVL